MTKICTKCGIEYPRTREYFPPDKKHKDGFSSWCRNCCNTASRIYWASKKGKKRGKEYRQKNKGRRHKLYKKRHQTLEGYIIYLMGHIKQRCNNPNHEQYKNYGGRGIKYLFTVEELYNWFITNDIDPRGLDIHRVDNNGDYALDNIEFLDRSTHLKLHHPRKDNV